MRSSFVRFAAAMMVLCAVSIALPTQETKNLPAAADAHSGGQHMVYLTFDDGPSQNTDAVLDILLEENIRATFFVTGVDTEEGIFRYNRILEEGHALGLHSYSHVPYKIYASRTNFSADFEKLNALIEKETGETIKICRMVGGSNTQDCPASRREEILSYLYENGYACFDWDIDSKDSLGYAVPAWRIAQNVITAAKKKPNQDLIVLLHDDSLRTTLPEALPKIIRYFQENDYGFAVLSEGTESIRRMLPKRLLK